MARVKCIGIHCVCMYTLECDMTWRTIRSLFSSFRSLTIPTVQFRLNPVWKTYGETTCDSHAIVQLIVGFQALIHMTVILSTIIFDFYLKKIHFLTLTLSQNRRFSQSSARFPLWTVFNVYMLLIWHLSTFDVYCAYTVHVQRIFENCKTSLLKLTAFQIRWSVIKWTTTRVNAIFQQIMVVSLVKTNISSKCIKLYSCFVCPLRTWNVCAFLW